MDHIHGIYFSWHFSYDLVLLCPGLTTCKFTQWTTLSSPPHVGKPTFSKLSSEQYTQNLEDEKKVMQQQVIKQQYTMKYMCTAYAFSRQTDFFVYTWTLNDLIGNVNTSSCFLCLLKKLQRYLQILHEMKS